MCSQVHQAQIDCDPVHGLRCIDLEYCADHDVTICNVPDYSDATVAEYTSALLLAAVRYIVLSAR